MAEKETSVKTSKFLYRQTSLITGDTHKTELAEVNLKMSLPGRNSLLALIFSNSRPYNIIHKNQNFLVNSYDRCLLLSTYRKDSETFVNKSTGDDQYISMINISQERIFKFLEGFLDEYPFQIALDSIIEELSKQTKLIISSTIGSSMREIFQICNELTMVDNPEFYAAQVAYHLDTIRRYITFQTLKGIHSIKAPIITPEHPNSDLIIQIHQTQNYLEEHYAAEIDLEVLFNQCGISRSAYYAAFKTITGTTPYKYLTQVRIKHALTLLQNTNLSIAEISAQCGFLDENTFYNAFRRKTGLCPSAYRKKNA